MARRCYGEPTEVDQDHESYEEWADEDLVPRGTILDEEAARKHH